MAEYRTEEYYDGTDVNVCLTQASNPWTMTFFLMTISAFFLLPLVILIILYAIIAKNLISKDGAMHKIRPSKPEQSLKARKQVVFMLGAVVLSFFLCLLPFRILTLWIILVPDEKLKNVGMENYYNLLYFCRIMLYLNSAINPILYNLMSSKFRKGFKKVYCCFLWQKHRLVNGHPRVATLNTTTSSFLTHSSGSGRKSDTQKTKSLDDLRIKENGTAAGDCASKDGIVNWHHNSLKRTVTDTNDELRKFALKNYGRQRSTTSNSGDEDTEFKKCIESQPIKPLRQTSYDESATQQQQKQQEQNKNQKKMLFFQYSLDERKISSNNSFHTLENNLSNNKMTLLKTDQSCIVPFLR